MKGISRARPVVVFDRRKGRGKETIVEHNGRHKPVRERGPGFKM